MAGFEFHEKGQVNHQGDDGENHAAHGTDGKREPEDLFRTFVYKLNQAQNSGDDGQKNRDDFVVIGFQIIF